MFPFRTLPLLVLLPTLTCLLSCGGENLVLPSEGEPANLEVFQGNGQSGRVGSALAQPVGARVTDMQQRPVADVPVVLVLTGDSAGADVVPDTADTDDDGVATFRVVLGTHLGPVAGEVRVVTPGPQRELTAPVTFTALSADANALAAVSGDDQSAPAGAPLSDPLVVSVTDAFGNPIPGVSIAWVADGGGSVSASTSVTGEDGRTSIRRTLGPTAGLQQTIASAPGLAGSPVTFTHTATAGQAARLEIVSGDQQMAVVGTPVPNDPIVSLTDAAGNPVIGMAITWVIGDGGGSVAPETSTTDEQGHATTRWTLGPAPGRNTVSAVVSSVGVVTFNATAIAGTPPGMRLLTQPPANASRGVVFSRDPIVQLVDPSGADLHQSGVPVSVTLATGSGTLHGPLASATDGEGRVTFPGLDLRGIPGRYTLAFSAPGFTGVTSEAIALSKAGTTTSIIADTPDPSEAGALVQVAFAVQSPGDTPVGSVQVKAEDGASCTAAVSAGGCALAPTRPGTQVLTASYLGSDEFESSSDTESHTVAAAPPTPSATASTVTASPSSIPIGGQSTVTVTVKSSNGGTLGGVGVTLSVSGSGNTVTPTSGATNSSGIVQFRVSSTVAEDKTLTAVAGGVTLSQQATVTVTQAATTTRITADTPDPSTAGGTVSVQYSVTSASGTPSGSVTVTVSGGGESCSGSVADGTCSLTLTGLGDRTLTATYGGDATFSGSSGTEPHRVNEPAPLSLLVATQPSSNALAGVPFDHQPVVQLRQGSANLAQAGVVVSAALASGGGTLTGQISATTGADGRAAFADLAIAGSEGQHTLSFSASGFTSAISRSIEVTRAATQTRITADDPDPSTVGTPVTVSFSVTSSAGTPTGTVSVSSDGGESCNGSVADGGCGMTFSTAGTRTLTATYAGDERFAGSSSASASHTVQAPNAPPVAAGDDAATAEDVTLTVPAPGVLGNDSDPEGADLGAEVVGGPSHGQLTLNADGSFIYAPSPDFFGEDAFTYRASDGLLVSNTATVTLTVNPVNDAPSFTEGPDQNVSPLAGAQSVSGWATDLSAGPANESEQALSFETSTDDDGAFLITPSVSLAGTLTYTPSPLQLTPVTVTVTVRVHDDGGTVNGGVDVSAPQTFSISISP
ncbi:MAG: Ig-like domain-containing protein [Gemmatimonadales bacterium]